MNNDPSGFSANPLEKPERKCDRFERLLLLWSLLVAILADLLVLNTNSMRFSSSGYALFWLAYLGVYHVLNWQRVKGKRQAFYVAAACALACVWMLLYAQEDMQIISHLLLPFALMLHAQLGVLEDTAPLTLFANTFFGFFAQPFTAVNKLFSSLICTVTGKSKRFLYVALGLLAAIPVSALILALLLSADSAFGYFGERLLRNFDLGALVSHLVCIFIAMMLFYSFFWNLKYKPENYYAPKAPAPAKLEPLAVGVVLGVMLIIYLLFSVVQTTFLFGRAQLPAGITYSEYARSGFFQLIAAAGINFMIFGLSLRFTKPSKAIRPLLLGLLAATCILLVGGVVRLCLYIEQYGLTFMRIAPMWFMVFLAIVLALCCVKLFAKKLELIKLSAAILMALSLALGFINVDTIIARHNLAKAPSDKDNIVYVYSLSNDCIDELIDNAAAERKDGGEGYGDMRLKERLERLRETGAYTLSDMLALKKLEAYFARQGA